MTTGGLLMCVPMAGLLAWAAVVDLRARRIPNWLTCSLALGGLAQSWTWAHTVTPGQSALGFLAGFGVTFVFFGIGAMGGGDVKLMAALGAWLGPLPTVVVFAVAAVIGMAFVIGQAAVQGRLRALFRNSAVIAVTFAHAGEIGIEQAADTGRACSGTGRPLPYAVPVLLATVLTIQWMR